VLLREPLQGPMFPLILDEEQHHVPRWTRKILKKYM
jgi:hypothetical protein